MLTIRDLDQYYGESHTLRAVALDVPSGECTCLMGRNGVGKTTLLKALMGLLPIRRGRILFQGIDLADKRPEQRARLGIGYVPQGREIFSELTVEENLKLALLARGQGSDSLDRVFVLFPVLGKMLHRRGGDLSGGQQQQLAIGRALAQSPKLLILDEPTEGIQPNVVHEIAEVIATLRDEGLTLLLVEQKLPFARRIAQQFVILDRGSNVANGEMSALNPELVARYLVV